MESEPLYLRPFNPYAAHPRDKTSGEARVIWCNGYGLQQSGWYGPGCFTTDGEQAQRWADNMDRMMRANDVVARNLTKCAQPRYG